MNALVDEVFVDLVIGSYTIRLVQCGPTSAAIDFDHDEAGDYQTYDLTNVRVAGDVLTCQTPALFEMADVTIALSVPDAPPAVTITIAHSLFKDGATVYALTPEQRASLAAFIAAAKFPAT